MTIVFLFAGSSGLMDPMTLSSPEESEEVNQDFLALSDVANATQNFRVRRSELTCANGDCGGGDVLKVVSQLAKRLLSDPRILRRNSAIFARKGRANSSPFTAASYYQSPGDNVQMESLRNDRYVDYESSDNNFRDPFKQTQGFGADSGGFFDDYVDNSVQSDDSSIANVADRDGGGHDSYSAGHDSYSAGHDSYSGGQESYGGGHDSYGGSSYGGSSYGGSSYGGSYSEGCCENKYLPILLVGSLGLLAFYLYLRSTTTTAAAAARRYDQNDEDISDVLLDGPTWLSLVHELWEQDGALEDPSCAQETLCRMNRMAMAAPGQAGWAVSLSSMPLSYLLHIRHTGGFTNYMDASLMGRSGGNCTQLYSSCSRFH